MNIGLIDVDKTRFPNLALGKIAAYHRSLGDSVEWADPMFGIKGLIAVFGYIIRSKSLAMSDKIRNFAIANKMVVDYSEWATVIAQRVWAFFMSILYPHTAVSLRKIKPFGVYHLVSSANDTAFCVCNPSKQDSMEQEIWKDIPGYEGAYQASNKGRIKRLESVVEVNSHIYRRTVPAHICKQYPQRNGYVAVNLFKGGAQKRCNVHRLIAVTFIPNPECLPQVNHKDENKTNNCIENLEWCSAQYNINYGDRTRRMSYTQGKRVRVTNKQSGESKIFLKIQDAVNELNIPSNGRMNISKCLRGIIKSAYGYKWEYA